MLKKNSYNPDVLVCLANLSSDEVFTPPALANQILDALPVNLWSDKNAKFLDPASKSGVFLREITKRLDKGLEVEIPDKIERINHICKNQLFGIAITELTSLLSRRSVYCSKTANGKYSVCDDFDKEQGNIIFERIEHTWKNGKCIFCAASQNVFDRGKELETHAYQFIHTHKPEEIFNMKFDVIIGNPPYQLDTNGAGRQAKPIYNLFVEQAKKLKPKFLTMIIPSRWFAGGMGLDEFRNQMMNDNHITKLVDFSNAKECFPENSISGGVCYFLSERDRTSECEFTNINNGQKIVSTRSLNEFSVLVRYNKAVSILRKIRSLNEILLDNIVSSLMPYGLSTDYRGNKTKISDDDLILYASDGITYINPNIITKGHDSINKYKIIMSKTGSEHAGEPGKDGRFKVITSSTKVIKPGEVCTHSYFIIGNYDNFDKAENTLSYLKTKFVRFLILQSMSSINLSKLVFSFVPLQDFSEPWSDEKLYKKYGLDAEEIAFIESMIKPMGEEEN